MGRMNTLEEQIETVHWATSYRGHNCVPEGGRFLTEVVKASDFELKKYFALAALSRSKTAPEGLTCAAWNEVFRVRVAVEKSIHSSIQKAIEDGVFAQNDLYLGSFFGASKKQGVSVRFPLTACRATNLCGNACYAHDVLDASPGSIVRGVVNGFIASTFEHGSDTVRENTGFELLIPDDVPETPKPTPEQVKLKFEKVSNP